MPGGIIRSELAGWWACPATRVEVQRGLVEYSREGYWLLGLLPRMEYACTFPPYLLATICNIFFKYVISHLLIHSYCSPPYQVLCKYH